MLGAQSGMRGFLHGIKFFPPFLQFFSFFVVQFGQEDFGFLQLVLERSSISFGNFVVGNYKGKQNENVEHFYWFQEGNGCAITLTPTTLPGHSHTPFFNVLLKLSRLDFLRFFQMFVMFY
jgi:hypothetical protein